MTRFDPATSTHDTSARESLDARRNAQPVLLSMDVGAAPAQPPTKTVVSPSSLVSGFAAPEIADNNSVYARRISLLQQQQDLTQQPSMRQQHMAAAHMALDDTTTATTSSSSVSAIAGFPPSPAAVNYAAMFEDFGQQLGAGDVPAMYSHRLWPQPRDVNIVFGRDVIQVPLKIEHANNEYVNLVLSHREFDVMAVHIPKYDEMRPAELLDEITERLKEQIEKQKHKRNAYTLTNNQLGEFPDSTASFQARILELEYELSRFKTKLAAARALQTTLTDENTVLRSNLREMEQRCVENETLKMQNEVLREQSVTCFAENTKLKKLLTVAQQDLHELGSQVRALRTQVHYEQNEITMQVDHSMQQLISHVRDREHVLQESYREEKKERQLIAEKYYEISGRIRVFCRMRPVTRSLHKPATSALVRPKPNSILVDRSGKEFSFDQVFGPEHSQADVYAQMEPVVVSFADGYNACIMAYGQTGSGKTFTMVGGSGEAQGMIPRALQQVFSVVSSRQLTYKDSLTVNMVEIYNDQIVDLLTEGNDSVKIKNENEITSRSVTLWEHVNAVLAEGNANRNIASTSMNLESSRSHALVFLHLESQHRETLEIRKSTLCLVDLAGSERISRSQVEGDRLRETQHINKSLSALGDVMHALQHKAKHVPYRNSKLTYMLRDMLSGQAKTLMMLQLSPEEDDLEETICSLQFGARVSQIQMGAVKTSVESGEIFRLKEENRTLEKKMRSLEEQLTSFKLESRAKLDELEDSRHRNQKLQPKIAQQHEDIASLHEKLDAGVESPPASPEKNRLPPSPSMSSRSVRSTQSSSSSRSGPAAPSTPSRSGAPRPTGGIATAAATSSRLASLARPSPRSAVASTAATTPTLTPATAARVARRQSLTNLTSPSASGVLSARDRLAKATNDPANRRATLGAIGSSSSSPNLTATPPSRAAKPRALDDASSPPTSTTTSGLAKPSPMRRTNSLATPKASSTTSSASKVSATPSSTSSTASAPSSKAPSSLEKRRSLASSRSLPSTPLGSTSASRTRTPAKP